MSTEPETLAKAGTETLNIVNTFMKEVLTDALKLKDFAVEQLPDVVQQFLQWRFYMHIVEATVPLLLFCICIYLCIKAWQYGFEVVEGRYGTSSRLYNDEGKAIVPVVVTSVISFVMFLITLCSINIKWLQILVAPKVYLLEYAASLIK